MRIYVRCKNCKGALAVIDYSAIAAGIGWLTNQVPREPTLLLELHVCKTVWKKYPADFQGPSVEEERKKIE